MAFADLREYMAALEELGHLHRIKAPVHWDGELGTIMYKVARLKGPALLFENVVDHEGSAVKQVFIDFPNCEVETALTLRLPPDSHRRDLVRRTRQMLREREEPRIVDSGPVKDVRLYGDEVNLFDFPVPKYCQHDGGRYVFTVAGLVTRDPDNGILNIGIYRGMVADRNHVSLLLIPTQGWGVHFAKYQQRGEPMPVAAFLGGDPALQFAAASPVPADVCEYDVAGGLRGTPVDLVRCETSDLLVPAGAEIVMEGVIDPNPAAYLPEGPFFEFTGYYGGETRPRPTMEVQCITMRDDAIFKGGRGQSPVMRPAVTLEILERAGVPGIEDVWCADPAGHVALIQMTPQYQGHAKQVAAALWGSSAAPIAYKVVICVDGDVDIHNPQAIYNALAYNLSPADGGVVIFPGSPGNTLDASVPLELRDELTYGAGRWDRLLLDATRNVSLPRRPEWNGDFYPPTGPFSDEHDTLTEERWAEYGLSELREGIAGVLEPYYRQRP